jgi:hypothetical protein
MPDNSKKDRVKARDASLADAAGSLSIHDRATIKGTG